MSLNRFLLDTLKLFSKLFWFEDFEAVDRGCKIEGEKGEEQDLPASLMRDISKTQNHRNIKIWFHLKFLNFFHKYFHTNYKENRQTDKLTWSMAIMEERVLQENSPKPGRLHSFN